MPRQAAIDRSARSETETYCLVPVLPIPLTESWPNS